MRTCLFHNRVLLREGATLQSGSYMTAWLGGSSVHAPTRPRAWAMGQGRGAAPAPALLAATGKIPWRLRDKGRVRAAPAPATGALHQLVEARLPLGRHLRLVAELQPDRLQDEQPIMRQAALQARGALALHPGAQVRHRGAVLRARARGAPQRAPLARAPGALAAPPLRPRQPQLPVTWPAHVNMRIQRGNG